MVREDARSGDYEVVRAAVSGSRVRSAPAVPIRPSTYATEHGPLGGDELNIVLAGANYGWPLFSYGLNYDGTRVSDMSEDAARAVSILPANYWVRTAVVVQRAAQLAARIRLERWSQDR